ncbi:hypothetical protein [Winogradskyella ursingii]|uniref:hypothetical protein n=1 Tax=Winogradskyella ursingii TaxID=2686079 RepID=UPI0015CCB6DF|nr:hypothetical protein [Winogradskyella ursingii]
MNWIERHKALIITFLIAGIVVLSMFSISLTKQSKFITESYYELDPEPEKTEEELVKEVQETQAIASNKAFNEDQEYKEMMRNFRTVNPSDFERTTKTETEETEELLEETSLNKSYSNGNAYALKAEETSSYKQLQEELKKRLDNKKQAAEHAKAKSTLTYSLKGRTLQSYKTPRYLCEDGGKIVITIEVNGSGNVVDASVNGASNSNNQCLIDHAKEYAKSVSFDASSKSSQIGTITFLFKRKS